MSHTPGPWKLVTREHVHAIVPKFGHDVTWVPTKGHKEHGSIAGRERSDDELLANAKLIAAAPDLLEALRDVLEHFEWLDAGGEPSRAYDRSVAAIGKATGQ